MLLQSSPTQGLPDLTKRFTQLSVTVLVLHTASHILQDQRVSHLSTARFGHYLAALLNMANVTVKRSTTLNAASLLLVGDGEEHNCSSSAHPDLSGTPLTNPDSPLFGDGSASWDPVTGKNTGTQTNYNYCRNTNNVGPNFT